LRRHEHPRGAVPPRRRGRAAHRQGAPPRRARTSGRVPASESDERNLGGTGGEESPMKRLDLGSVPGAIGEVPEKMMAAVIRKEPEGEPVKSMQIEEVNVPEVGPGEVLVLTMAAGVNFNGVWAARGRPVSVFKMHKEPFHIAGSDASGIVWKVGSEV